MIAGKIQKGWKVLEEARIFLKPIEKEHLDLVYYADYINAIYFSKKLGAEPKVENLFLSTFKNLETLSKPSPYLRGQILRKLGILNQFKGDFQKAVDYFQQEISIYQKYYVSDHFDIGVVHYSLGGVYYELLEYQKALDHYLPAYEIWKSYYKPSRKYMRYLTEAIGDMYWELGQKEKALPFYNLSVVGKKNNTHPKLLELNRADSMANTFRFDDAMNIYEDALAFRKGLYGDKHAITGACQNQIARAYLRKDQYNDALDAYQLALTMLVKDFNETTVFSNPDQKMQVISEQYLLESMFGKTLALKKKYDQTQKTEDLELAYNTAGQAIKVFENLRQSPLGESSKGFWTRKYFSLFDIVLELAHKRYGDGPEFIEIAFPIIENSKTFLLQNALRFNQESSILGLPPNVLEKEKEIKKAIQKYVIQIEQEERLCNNAQVKKLELWNEELFKLKLEYNIFLEGLKTDHPKYYNLKYNHQFLPLDTIKNKILQNDKSILIEYFEGEEYIYTLAFSRHQSFSFRIAKDSLFDQQLQHFTGALYNVETLHENPRQQIIKFSRDAAELYQKLLHPVLNYFPDSIQQLFIIPDKRMFYLPFECLLTSEVSDAKDYRDLPYLLNHYEVSYSQSAEVLARAYFFDQSEKFKYEYLGFAPNQFMDQEFILNPLNWNREEVKKVDEIWDGKTFLNASATRKSFMKHATHAKIQHVATHALIDNENPMLSRIVFQGDTTNALFTYDLYALPVRSELIVLNACNTGRGKWEQGEGMISLESAFQYAGCPALLTSTWTIDDEASSTITIDFFDFLKTGPSEK